MLQVLRFIFSTIIDFISMLFTIDLGNNLNLGLLMCIVFIFLPMMLRIINFLKQDAMEELNNAYEESRPRESWSSTEHQRLKIGNGKWFTTNHTRTRSRRYKL